VLYQPLLSYNTCCIRVAETFKASPASEAKSHRIEPTLYKLLYQQRTINALATEGLVASFTAGESKVKVRTTLCCF